MSAFAAKLADVRVKAIAGPPAVKATSGTSMRSDPRIILCSSRASERQSMTSGRERAAASTYAASWRMIPEAHPQPDRTVLGCKTSPRTRSPNCRSRSTSRSRAPPSAGRASRRQTAADGDEIERRARGGHGVHGRQRGHGVKRARYAASWRRRPVAAEDRREYPEVSMSTKRDDLPWQMELLRRLPASIDPSQIEESLRQTPTERLERMQRLVEFLEEVQRADGDRLSKAR
jgi:hypothetical protein